MLQTARSLHKEGAVCRFATKSRLTKQHFGAPIRFPIVDLPTQFEKAIGGVK